MKNEHSADELLCGSVTDVVLVLNGNDTPRAAALLKAIEGRAAAAMTGFNDNNRELVDRLTTILMQVHEALMDEGTIKILAEACFYYSRIGRAYDGIPRGLAARRLAEKRGLKNLERLAGNNLGAAYVDGACFDEACSTFERTLVLARDLDEPILESLAITNTAALLREMGLYQDAIEVADKALTFDLESPRGRFLSLTNAANGIFSAHRLRNDEAALRYMRIGSEMLEDNPMADIVLKTNFEYFRAMYLLHKDDHETAELLIASAKARAANIDNPRVRMMLDIASALCNWASRDAQREARARKQLRELYHESKQTRLYHDDVLRALIEVHKRTLTGEITDLDRKHAKHPDDVSSGLDALRRIVMETSKTGVDYAKELVAYTAGPSVKVDAGKELVEYTTGVKNAKFYRQLSDRGGLQGDPRGQVPDPFDPFVGVRRWLDDEDPSIAIVDISDPFRSAKSPVARHEVRKHDELTAIHGDIAVMRIDSLKAAMRTAAYDVAENWALAAEFFDDQTGEHCFRVGRLAGLLAAEIGIDPENCLRIEHAARLHDIGKIAVNEMILLKPGPLDATEVEAMRAHTEVGAQLLESSSDQTLQMAAAIAKYHHAWWNGAGYPKVSGESIPLAARICAYADVYDALTNVRPYKCAWPHRLAVEQMLLENGAHFDPRLMTPFLKVLERHIGSTAQPPSTKLHLTDMEANGLLTSRRSLMLAVQSS
jgi:putative nucleotidyltransferase with HDIG domain